MMRSFRPGRAFLAPLVSAVLVQGLELGLDLPNAVARRDMDDNMPGMRGTEAQRTVAHIAHGTVISIAIVLFFPMGGMIMRLSDRPIVVRLHIFWQLFSMLVLVTGFALGVWLSVLHNEIWNKQHEQFGTVIFLLFLAQPMLGMMHHHYFTVSRLSSPDKEPNPWFGRAHAWYGRILIILGVINGGLGLQLGANTTSGEIAYGVVAGVMFVVYVAVWAWSYKRRSHAAVARKASSSIGGEEDVELS